jgi:hypothetical protein
MYESDKQYAEHNAKSMVGARYIGGDVGPKQIEKPRIAQQLDQLEKTLHECLAITGSVEHVADRLTGPVPEKTGGNAGDVRPTSSTVEQRLAEVSSLASYIAARLSGASQRLNSAV